MLVVEAATPETYGRAFGLERAMDSAEAVIGPALELLIASTWRLRPVFFMTLVPGLATAILIAVLVRERRHQVRRDGHLLSDLGRLPPQIGRCLAGVGLAGLGDDSNTLLILWATQAWAASLGPVRAAHRAMLFYVGYNVVYTFISYVSGHLADRWSRRWILAGGYALACVPAAALMTAGSSVAKCAVVFCFSGLYMGVWETVESATAATLLPESDRGSGFGTLATVDGLGDLAR